MRRRKKSSQARTRVAINCFIHWTPFSFTIYLKFWTRRIVAGQAIHTIWKRYSRIFVICRMVIHRDYGSCSRHFRKTPFAGCKALWEGPRGQHRWQRPILNLLFSRTFNWFNPQHVMITWCRLSFEFKPELSYNPSLIHFKKFFNHAWCILGGHVTN